MLTTRPGWVERRASRLVAAFGVDRATALREAESDWRSLRGTSTGRSCCDGQCQQGRQCPAFAPGVLEGPFKRSSRLRQPIRVRTALESVAAGLQLFWDYLKGPRP